MAWIESHQTLADHPKTRKLAHLLGVSVPAAIGHLHCLWWWALDYSDDGSLAGHDSLDIAIGAKWDGDADDLVEALIRVGFLDVSDTSDDDADLSIHDWYDYGGKLTSRRKANAERMRKARAEQDSTRATHVQRTQRTRAERQYSTQHNIREENTIDDDGADAPVAPRRKPPRKTRIDDMFLPNENTAAWCAKEGFTVEQVQAEIPKFVDSHAAKGTVMVDWQRAFQTWMRNAREWGKLQGPGNKPSLKVYKNNGGFTPEAMAERARREA